MTDYEHQKTLLTGAIIGCCFTILAFYMMKPSSENHTVTPEKNFAVVDTYKGCDVVQWSDNQMATYKYFLDCTDSMRNK